jgi:hypothetical protein
MVQLAKTKNVDDEEILDDEILQMLSVACPTGMLDNTSKILRLTTLVRCDVFQRNNEELAY